MKLVCAAMLELLQAKRAVLLYSYAAVTGRLLQRLFTVENLVVHSHDT